MNCDGGRVMVVSWGIIGEITLERIWGLGKHSLKIRENLCLFNIS